MLFKKSKSLVIEFQKVQQLQTKKEELVHSFVSVGGILKGSRCNMNSLTVNSSKVLIFDLDQRLAMTNRRDSAPPSSLISAYNSKSPVRY